MLIVNFSHPLTPEQVSEIELKAGLTVRDVWHLPAKFEDDQSYGLQAEQLAARAGVSGAEWQMQPVLVVLPGSSLIAAALLAVLHGRLGHFPAVARLVRGPEPVPRYSVAEILNLQKLREDSRRLRSDTSPLV